MSGAMALLSFISINSPCCSGTPDTVCMHGLVGWQRVLITKKGDIKAFYPCSMFCERSFNDGKPAWKKSLIFLCIISQSYVLVWLAQQEQNPEEVKKPEKLSTFFRPFLKVSVMKTVYFSYWWDNVRSKQEISFLPW